MKIKLPKTDRILGVSAMIISILTLVIFIYQTNIINKQSKLAVKPHLSFFLTQSGNDSIITFTQLIQNKGLGPAIVKNAKIAYEGKEYPLFFDLFLYDIYPEADKYAELVSSTAISEYKILSPNESLIIYRINVPTNKASEFFNYIGINENEVNGKPKWNFEITYTSMYEDKNWRIDEKKNIPERN